MEVHRCPLCHAVVLVVMEGNVDEAELANKQAAHEIMRH